METTQNASSCFEQILGAESNKTAAVQPLTSHHTNNPSKTSKAWDTVYSCRSKVQLIILWTFTYGHTKPPPTTTKKADKQKFTFISFVCWLVGWVLRHANPSGYFMPKTFLSIIFIWYNFYAYSYLNAINKYQRHQNKTICSLELSAEVSIWFFI